jgi:hypothetical protein
VAYGGLALSWLRKELYRAKVKGVYWHDRSELRVSAEGYNRIIRVLYSCLKPSGVVARRGGEKFSLVLKQVGASSRDFFVRITIPYGGLRGATTRLGKRRRRRLEISDRSLITGLRSCNGAPLDMV